MIEELRKAAAYAHRVIVRLKNGDTIEGKAQLSGDPTRAKIRTDEGHVWIPYEDIEFVERLAKQLH